MSWLIALGFGLVVGLFVSAMARPERRSYITDAVMGMAGALLGVWFFGDIIHAGGGITRNIGYITFLGAVWSVIGAAVLTFLAQAAISSGEERAEKGPAYFQSIRRRKDRDDDESRR